MNITLYELASEFRATADQLSDMDLPDEVIADTLEAVALPVEQKATSVAAFIRNLEAAADQIKQAEQAMSARRKAIENRAARVKDYLLENMQRCEITKIESPFFKISLRDNPPAVVIDDETKIPVDYMREIPATYQPDKASMKSAMLDGYEVPGAHLERKKRVEIK